MNITPISASCCCGARRSVQVSSQRAEQRRADRRGLHRDAALGQAERVGGDDAEPGDLRDRQVDEDDAAVEHLLPSGTCVASTSRPAISAGPRMPQSSALQFMAWRRGGEQARDGVVEEAEQVLRAVGAADGERQLDRRDAGVLG